VLRPQDIQPLLNCFSLCHWLWFVWGKLKWNDVYLTSLLQVEWGHNWLIWWALPWILANNHDILVSHHFPKFERNPGCWFCIIVLAMVWAEHFLLTYPLWGADKITGQILQSQLFNYTNTNTSSNRNTNWCNGGVCTVSAVPEFALRVRDADKLIWHK
jgi:hypothetical protein